MVVKEIGTINDTINFQKAINFCHNRNVEKLIVPTGVYLIEKIKLYRDMNIEGASLDSIIKSINNNQENCLILIEDDAGHNLTIKNLFLEGNKENQNTLQDGIKIMADIGWRDVYMLLDNLRIRNFSKNGIYASSKNGNFYAGWVFSNIETYDNNYHGMHIVEGTDCIYNNCVSFMNLKSGFWIEGTTSNSRYTNCKAYWNGNSLDSDNKKYPGFHISGSRSSLTNCEAQDNYGHGFAFYRGNNYNLIGYIADQNGNMGLDSNGNRNTRENIGGEPEYCGVVLNNVGGMIIEGQSTNFLYSTIGYTQRSPLLLINACENITANIMYYAQYTDIENYSSAKNLFITYNQKQYKLYCPSSQITVNENYEIYDGVPFEVYKIGNIVHIKGAVKGKNSTVLPTADDVKILTLPSGFRTDHRIVFPAFLSNNNLYHLNYVGNCTLYGGGLVQVRGNSNLATANCVLLDIEYEATN